MNKNEKKSSTKFYAISESNANFSVEIKRNDLCFDDMIDELYIKPKKKTQTIFKKTKPITKYKKIKFGDYKQNNISYRNDEEEGNYSVVVDEHAFIGYLPYFYIHM
jgi:hypothetical protein